MHPARAAFGCGVFLWAAAFASAQSNDLSQISSLIGDYNAISFGNAEFSFNGQDVQGPIAVGGNATFGGNPLVSLSQFDNSTDPDLYVKGTFSINNGDTVQLENGYAALPGNAGTGTYPFDNLNTRYQPAGTTGWLEVDSSVAHSNTDPRSNPIGRWATTSMSTLQTDLTNLSNNLGTFGPTGTISVVNNVLTFTGAATGITVFNLNASQLLQNGSLSYYGTSMNNNDQFNSIGMSIPTGAFYVINVTGAGSDPNTIFGSGVNFNLNGDQTQPSRLLWNLTGSGSVTLGNGGQFFGSVLAPQMAVSNGQNDPLSGQLIAASIDYQNAELHDSMLEAIPEPSTWALVAGLAALGLGFTRCARAVA